MSSLETSVTLEDVFTVVEAKRVPLAPELAGYLTLEIADGTDAGGGEVDPRTVFISEEGTVALVRPRKDSPVGDAESSIRAMLAKLLEASGLKTPALAAVAKRRAGTGLPALVEELEAALIPVNRAAGRRALARLAREVKRVTLGVGRNASAAPIGLSTRPPPPPREPSDPGDRPLPSLDGGDTRPRGSKFEDEAATVKRSNRLAELAAAVNDVPAEAISTRASAARASSRGIPRGGSPLPPPPKAQPPGAPPPPARRDEKDKLFGGDEVDSLLDAFEVGSSQGEREMSRDLKAIAGLDPTPPPPDAASLASLVRRPASKDGDDVEALLALADATGPLAPPLPPPGFGSRPFIPAAPAPDPADVSPTPPLPPPPLVPEPEGLGAPPELARPDSPPRPIANLAVSASARRERALVPDAPAPPGVMPPTTRRRGPVVPGQRQPRAPRTGFVMLVLTLVVLVGGGVAMWMFKPQFFTGRRPERPSVADAGTTVSPVTASKCRVALVLNDVPPNAEILLRTGQAPVDVERMPVGTRLEFVATAEGYAPRRAVVKAESQWDRLPDGKPRIEVPIQLDPSRAKSGSVDPWPAAEPGSEVGGSGAPGTVHVVSNVRGAEVWLLAGLGPTARIEQLRCDAPIDVLLAGPASQRKRLHLGETEVSGAPNDAQGNKTITLSAK